ncbi:MAG: GPP34 family phosphoprotein [Chloroflexota bacterium]|nr:GPP34 family phosphoprotein [Chloroflexota bacterium]
MLRITEEILLLIIDSEKGGIHTSLSDHSRDVVIAGAVLMDLALERRIDTDLQQLIPVDPTPLGDDLLDPTLADICRETDYHDTAYWVTRTAARSDETRQKALHRLVAHGILESHDNGIHLLSRLVSRVRRYPHTSTTATEDVKIRIMRVIFSQDIPDRRDALIIELAAACGVFESLLSQTELAEAQARIDQIAQLDLVGRTVTEALRQAEPPATRSRPIRPFAEVPEASGWPILGNALEMAGDLRAFLTRQYLQHGPIFRVRAFDRRYVALVGAEANLFVTNSGQNHLRSFETWREFNSVNGSLHVLMSMDGPEHLRMRKVQADGYSPKLIEGRLNDVVDLTRRAIAGWP